MIGETVSHYRVEEKLGEGGMGIVYRARDLRLDRSVALKFLPSHLVADPRAKERFLHEARAASALDHPNICTIHEIAETQSGALFIAMAHYTGETLAERIRRGPLPVDEALEITRQLALALGKAHERGIVHRDVKPANVIQTEDGLWKLLDFGIAKLSGTVRLTRTGQAVGTVAYKAPEQADRDQATPRSDIWSLGVVLYEMLTGRLPFEGRTPIATLYRILEEAPEPVSACRPDIPAALDRVVERALAKHPAARYSAMEEFQADVDELLSGGTPEVGRAVPPSDVESAAESAMEGPPPFMTSSSEPSDATDLPPFAGRDAELALLDGWLEEALAGRGRVGFVTGEAGTGKTALVREFTRRAAEAHPDLIVATGQCNAHTGRGDPHHPFREVLRQLTGDVEAQWAAGALSTDHATRLWGVFPATVRALLDTGADLVGTLIPAARLVARAEDHAGIPGGALSDLRRLAGPRGGGAAAREVELFDQCVELIRSVAKDRPFLLVLDDLQWGDQGSIELLFELGRRLAGTRILVIGLFRSSEVEAGRGGQRHPLQPVIHELTQIFGEMSMEVGELGGREFVERLVDAEPNRLDASFRSRLWETTGGHALFTVELLRAMRDRGALVQDESGAWIAGPDLDWSLLPARVEAVIAEAIERLPEDLQRLLTVASVEGEAFTLEVLARVDGLDVSAIMAPVALELERRNRLVVGEGLHQTNGRRLSRYRFRHILFQRFLYTRLADAERAYLHEQVGEALESLHGEGTDEIAAELARHFGEAGLKDQTAHYLYLAGQRAIASLAHREGFAYHEAALEALLTLPPGPERDRRELDLQTSLAMTGIGLGAATLVPAAGRAVELGEQVGSPTQVFWALISLYWVRGHYGGDYGLGRELAQRCLSIALKEDDPSMLCWALEICGRNAGMRNAQREGLEWLQESKRRFDREQHRSPFFMGMDAALTARGTLGVVQWKLGYPIQAWAHAAEMRTRAADPVTLQLALWNQIGLHSWSGEFAAARKLCDAGWTAISESGLPGLIGPAFLVTQGWCDAELGRVEEGVDAMARGMEELAGSGVRSWWAYFTALLARGLCLTGRADEGLVRLEEAIALEREPDGCLGEDSVVHRFLGDVLRAQPTPRIEDAETAFRTAVDLARRQEAKSFELEATKSLARLLRDTGRSEEALEMLSGVYDWFTEGHELPYLVEARRLLEELGARP